MDLSTVTKEQVAEYLAQEARLQAAPTPEMLLSYARRVARRMHPNDWIEADSIAGLAARKAHETYSGKIEWERWVFRLVKQRIWAHWRHIKSRREEEQAEFWTDTVMYVHREEDTDLRVSNEAWQLLYDYYVNHVPMDVLAKKRKITVHEVKRWIEAVRVRFIAEYREEAIELGLIARSAEEYIVAILQELLHDTW